MSGGQIKGVNQRLANSAVFFKINRVARRRQAHQPDAISKAPEIRLALNDGAPVEFGGKCQSGIVPLDARPGCVLGQLWAKLVDLGDEPLLDVTSLIDDQHGISQDPRQALAAFVVFARIGSRSRSGSSSSVALMHRPSNLVGPG